MRKALVAPSHLSRLAKAGVWVGQKAGRALATVDRDVYRHLAYSPLLAYSLFAPRTNKVTDQKPDGHLPLIFVHGMGGNRNNFLPMSGYLWLNGRKRSYRIHLDGKQSVEKMSARLAKFIDRVLKVTGESQVEIVAYSLGGVVSRLAILEFGLAPKVKTLVTLGSPHQGTFPARYANTHLTRELLPDSPIIQKLKKAKWPKGVRGVTVWSRNDLFILPPKSAAMTGTEQVDVSPFTHFSYLVDPKSWELVRLALKTKRRR